MLDFPSDRLRALGLTPALAARAAATLTALDAAPGTLSLQRIARVHRDALHLHDGSGEHPARVVPHLLHTLADDARALAVGDWVLAAADAHGDYWAHALVPHSTHIARRDAGGVRHAVASNVDTALLVMGLDDDFNPSRIERYLALVGAAGGITPVVVLTKADLAARVPGRIAARIEALRGRVSGRIDLHAIDGNDRYTVRQLQAHLAAGQTLVVLGSSGAGKSTLTNTLLGADTQDTGPVRAHDHRGRHTTTVRSLHRLPGGAWVIDTPGLRTLRADADEATLGLSFADIAGLAARCRFRDCTHAAEPDCAVREGVPAERLRNYQKLLRENRRDAIGPLERREQLATWKARARDSRERAKQRIGDG